MRALPLLLVSTMACGALDDAALDPQTQEQDDEAQAAPASDGKADSPASYVGLYTTRASTHRSGDITSLQLLAASTTLPVATYVRERCYDTACALPLPETDHYDVYTSTSGKTYVRFYSFTVARDATDTLVATPAIADVYEITRTTTTIKLRKSYTSRWFSLYPTTAAARCVASGGTATGSDCACPGNLPGQFPTQVFVPGADGCMPRPGDNEGNCDDSNGFWADDDATLTGAYCTCGLGRYDDATGTCATI